MTYEVQCRDGFGAWRRWSHMWNRASAESSLRRLDALMGEELVRLGATRIVERDA